MPNGYGPFEAFALLEAVLNLSGLQSLLRTVKRSLLGTPRLGGAALPTLAASPHVNFFSRRELHRLFAGAGLTVRRFRANTFLCGYGVDSLIRGKRMIGCNARLADWLPVCCASDWMFELSPGEARRATVWRRNRWGRFRRWLNQRRWIQS